MPIKKGHEFAALFESDDVWLEFQLSQPCFDAARGQFRDVRFGRLELDDRKLTTQARVAADINDVGRTVGDAGLGGRIDRGHEALRSGGAPYRQKIRA
jgi:hypothetical protein